MAIYRYLPESIDCLSRRTWWHHTAIFATFIFVVCIALLVLVELKIALIVSAIYVLSTAILLVALRGRGLQRIAKMIRSAEFEIDEENVCLRDDLRKTTVARSEIIEVRFTDSGIWLRGRRRRARIYIPPEMEDFDGLPSALEEWLPSQAMRSNSAPSSFWANVKFYGIWIGLALVLYASFASHVRVIAIPACVLVATGIAWYFAWCGRRISERKYKVLLPLTGYSFAAMLLIRALSLWVSR